MFAGLLFKPCSVAIHLQYLTLHHLTLAVLQRCPQRPLQRCIPGWIQGSLPVTVQALCSLLACCLLRVSALILSSLPSHQLYERWEKKYGRKWPENGLNTEDLVWLYNEAYQDERVKAGNAAAAADRPKTYPREKQDYEGQVGVSTEGVVCLIGWGGG